MTASSPSPQLCAESCCHVLWLSLNTTVDMNMEYRQLHNQLTVAVSGFLNYLDCIFLNRFGTLCFKYIWIITNEMNLFCLFVFTLEWFLIFAEQFLYSRVAKVWPQLSSELISEESREEIAHDFTAKVKTRLQIVVGNKQHVIISRLMMQRQQLRNRTSAEDNQICCSGFNWSPMKTSSVIFDFNSSSSCCWV